MKTITQFINEALNSKQKEIIGEYTIKMLEHTNISKEQLQKIFNNFIYNIEYCKIIFEYINKVDSKYAFAYTPSSDDFLNKDNYQKIIDNLVEYFAKYVVI